MSRAIFGKMAFGGWLLATLWLWSASAHAQIPPVQWQMIALGSVDVEAEDLGGEAQVNIGLYGIGLALGLGGEALARADSGWNGAGFVDLALQLRPMLLAASVREPHRPVYQIFDPHIDVGGLLGFALVDDEAIFRGQLYIGGALDFGIPTRYYWLEAQILISVGYRFVPVQGVASSVHYFTLGLGYRSGF